MIAEIVSLPGYESQVSALLNEEERMAMEFFVACTPEDHPVIPGTCGFRKFISTWSNRDGSIWLPIYAKSRKETLSATDQKVLAKLAAQIKKTAREGR